jgi:hypothetical protein
MNRLLALSALAICCTSCSGEKGPRGDAGAAGATGATGPAVTVSTLPVGDAHCAGGGAALTSAGVTGYACSGVPGVQHLRVLDGAGAALGTLVGTSLAWSNSGVATLQVISYLDADGLIWNVGAGGGGLILASVPLYFESADCSGAALLRNASPQAPVAAMGAGPSQGVYLAGAVVAAAPPSWLGTGATACTTSAPAPNAPPNVTVYRSSTRLGDFPPTPVPAPVMIAP